MTIKYIVSIVISCIFSLALHSQEVKVDSVSTVSGKSVVEKPSVEPDHSPKKAALLSTFLPGAGQIYNKKWWKAPIAWAGIGGAIYWGEVNRREYLFWKDQYQRRVDTNLTDDYPFSSTEFIQFQRNEYRRIMETSYVVAVGIYLLQIIDATVDAHLMTFDVSDDLSMNIQPAVLDWRNQANKPTFGLSVKLGFKK